MVLEHRAPDVGDAAEAGVAVADHGHVASGSADGLSRVDHVAEGGQSHVGVAEPGRGDAVAGHERTLEPAAASDELGAERIVHTRHRDASRLVQNLSESARCRAAVVCISLDGEGHATRTREAAERTAVAPAGHGDAAREPEMGERGRRHDGGARRPMRVSCPRQIIQTRYARLPPTGTSIGLFLCTDRGTQRADAGVWSRIAIRLTIGKSALVHDRAVAARPGRRDRDRRRLLGVVGRRKVRGVALRIHPRLARGRDPGAMAVGQHSGVRRERGLGRDPGADRRRDGGADEEGGQGAREETVRRARRAEGQHLPLARHPRGVGVPHLASDLPGGVGVHRRAGVSTPSTRFPPPLTRPPRRGGCSLARSNRCGASRSGTGPRRPNTFGSAAACSRRRRSHWAGPSTPSAPRGSHSPRRRTGAGGFRWRCTTGGSPPRRWSTSTPGSR